MRKPVSPDGEKLLNETDVPGARVFAFAVPTRIFRILQVDPEGYKFRIEQLVLPPRLPNLPVGRGIWTTLSSHASDVAGQSLAPAFNALLTAQAELVKKMGKMGKMGKPIKVTMP